MWPYQAQEKAGYGKIHLTPLSFLGCGILSPGFPPTHSVSPYLQSCLAKSCFALVLFCCELLFVPLSCRHEGEVGHGPVGSAHPSRVL